MGTREDLGAADVTDAQLATMVADLLHQDEVEVLDTAVSVVDYDLPAITTGGRWWVSGHAATPGGTEPFRFFVKQVQSWSRSPLFQGVPEHLQEWAESTVPWKTEAEVYRSDFGSLLPDGLLAPRSLGVFDLDEKSSSIWLEEVVARAATWDLGRYARAAYLLGRLSGNRELASLQCLRHTDFTLNTYVTGRLEVQVVPILMSDEVWQHPLCAAFDDDLRARLRAAAADAAALAAEGDALPYLLSHGDACPNNLLAGEHDDDFVMIDFGFWGGAPVGFDLTQLLVGDVQIGRRGSDGLAELDEAIVAAYVAGLRAEGCEIPEEQVRRGHALCLLIMTGLSALPFDLFEGPVDARTMQIAADRAQLARFALDLVEGKAGQPG
jgi:hypothetical protein